MFTYRKVEATIPLLLPSHARCSNVIHLSMKKIDLQLDRFNRNFMVVMLIERRVSDAAEGFPKNWSPSPLVIVRPSCLLCQPVISIWNRIQPQFMLQHVSHVCCLLCVLHELLLLRHCTGTWPIHHTTSQQALPCVTFQAEIEAGESSGIRRETWSPNKCEEILIRS